MKKLYSLSLPLIGILFISVTTVILSDMESKHVLEDLLTARTTLLESAYQGKISCEEVERQLPVWEADPLLEQDLGSLRQWQHQEYDRIADFQVQWCRKLSENDLGLVLNARIRWDMLDLEGEYTVWEEYLFQIEKRPLDETVSPKAVTDGQTTVYRLGEMIIRERPYV